MSVQLDKNVFERWVMYGTRSLGASFGAEVLEFQLSGTPSEADICLLYTSDAADE